MNATTMTVMVMAHFRVVVIGGASGAGDVIGLQALRSARRAWITLADRLASPYR
jgi:predicted ATPase